MGVEKAAVLTPAGLGRSLSLPAAEVALRCPGASGARQWSAAGCGFAWAALRSSLPGGRGWGRPGRSSGGSGTTKWAVKPPGGGCICCPVWEVRWLPSPGRS